MPHLNRNRKLLRATREKGTFADAWRDLDRRQSGVRWTFVLGFAIPAVVVKGIHTPEQLMALVLFVLAFWCLGWLCIRRPWVGLLMFTAWGYYLLWKPTPYGLPNIQLQAIYPLTWIFVFLAELHLYSFICPNCHQRYFSFKSSEKPWLNSCSHCGALKNHLYSPSVDEQGDISDFLVN